MHLQDDQRSSGEEFPDDLDARRGRLPSPLGGSGVNGGMGCVNSLEGLSGFGSLALVGGPSEADVVGGDVERFSRKVFVGGLPPDIDEEEITASFRRFGPLVVDWPHKAESKSYFPPKVSLGPISIMSRLAARGRVKVLFPAQGVLWPITCGVEM